MTIKTAIDFDKTKMVEHCVKFEVPVHIAERVLQNYINKKNYKERLVWIQNNVVSNIADIDEEELEQWMIQYGNN